MRQEVVGYVEARAGVNFDNGKNEMEIGSLDKGKGDRFKGKDKRKRQR